MKKPAYTTSEVAAFCHVTSDTIRKWTESGALHAFKTPGGHRRVRHENVIKFMREHNIPLPPELREERCKILLISQDNNLLSNIQKQLEKTHTACDFQIARDSFDAGRLVALFEPDVAIVDMAFQGTNASDICRRLTEPEEQPGTAVIAVVSSDAAEPLKDLVDKGVALLKKPFNPDELRKALAAVGIELV